MKDRTNRELFENTPVWKAVKTMAVPAVIGQLIVLAYSIADTFFIGRTDNPFMVAGASLILPVFNMTIPLAAIFGVGGSALISQLLGEKREEEASRVSSFCIYISLALGLLFSVAVWVFMKPMLNLLGADADTFNYAQSYSLCVLVAGGIPTILTNVFTNLVRSVGESKKAGFGVTLGGVTNIILDPLFMFVIFPDGQEILGAGVATFLSNVLTCIYFICVIRKLNKDSVLTLAFPKTLPIRKSISRILVIGVPSAIATLLFDVDYIVLDKLMSGYGNVALASIGIVLKAERLPLNVGIGICLGMVPIVAYNYAAHNFDRMRQVERFSFLCGLVCGVLSLALYECFAPYVMRFFIADTETVLLGTRFLRVRSLATTLMFISFFHTHLFNAYGRGKEALFLGVIRWVGFNIPMLFLFNRLFGMMGLVWAQLASDILAVITSRIVHRRFVKTHIEAEQPTPA